MTGRWGNLQGPRSSLRHLHRQRSKGGWGKQPSATGVHARRVCRTSVDRACMCDVTHVEIRRLYLDGTTCLTLLV